MQGILDRAAEYLAVDEVWKGEPLMMYVIYVIYVSIYLSDCLSIYLSIYLSVCLSVYVTYLYLCILGSSILLLIIRLILMLMIVILIVMSIMVFWIVLDQCLWKSNMARECKG